MSAESELMASPKVAGAELDCAVAERVMGWRRIVGGNSRERAIVLVPPDFVRHYAPPNEPKWTSEPITARASVPHYSTGILAAMEVVEKCGPLAQMTHAIGIDGTREHAETWMWQVMFRDDNDDSPSRLAYGYAQTLPLAICLTALKIAENRNAKPENQSLTHLPETRN